MTKAKETFWRKRALARLGKLKPMLARAAEAAWTLGEEFDPGQYGYRALPIMTLLAVEKTNAEIVAAREAKEDGESET